ncbi:STAS domain-containing protein [Pseudonocardia tropica]|uniref:STAS domain-containing protein n=1 Tax=Pseudonocardia tropica TaxID=681289 RepID=A0ABV1JXR4_9PSEU
MVGLRAELAHAGAAVSVVSLIGDVDLASRHVLAVALDGAAVAAGVGGRVVLDLDRVSFMGACGLGLVLAAHATASGLGGAVILVLDGDAPAARAVSLLVGAGPDIHPTLTAALAAAAA